MLTITITPRAVLLTAITILGGVLAFYATDALGSSQPDAYLQGDTNCDGIIDAQDALNDLRYTAGLTVGPFPNCPQVGSEAAIPGPPGPQGPQGEPGFPGISGLEVVVERTSTSSFPPLKSALAPCPAGKTLIGGGATTSDRDVYLNASVPWEDPVGWSATASEPDVTGQAWYVEAYAFCAYVAES